MCTPGLADWQTPTEHLLPLSPALTPFSGAVAVLGAVLGSVMPQRVTHDRMTGECRTIHRHDKARFRHH